MAVERRRLVDFFKLYCFTTGLGALVFVAYLLIRMLILWQVSMFSQSRSTLHFSFLVGTDVGVIVVILVALYTIPHMIVTWTTTLVVKFLLQPNYFYAEDAIKLARQLWHRTLRRALRSGEFVAIVAAICTLGFVTWLHPQGNVFNILTS
ncbi:hypothetical protein L7F22_031975 [Adiantum nelumboides]|nr:hypothetical protein [Adiantum nelumboides]